MENVLNSWLFYCHHSSFLSKNLTARKVIVFFVYVEQQEMCVCVEPLSQNTFYPKTGSCNLIHIYPVVNLSWSLYHSSAVLSMCC